MYIHEVNIHVHLQLLCMCGAIILLSMYIQCMQYIIHMHEHTHNTHRCGLMGTHIMHMHIHAVSYLLTLFIVQNIIKVPSRLSYCMYAVCVCVCVQLYTLQIYSISFPISPHRETHEARPIKRYWESSAVH